MIKECYIIILPQKLHRLSSIHEKVKKLLMNYFNANIPFPADTDFSA